MSFIEKSKILDYYCSHLKMAKRSVNNKSSSLKEKKIYNNALETIFNYLLDAYNNTDNLNLILSSSLETRLYKSQYDNHILNNNKYVSEEIKESVKNNCLYETKTTLHIGTNKYNITFITSNNSHKLQKKLQENIKKIAMWLYILSLHNEYQCNHHNTIEIILYLLKDEKKMPQNHNHTLGINNVNSALTYVCIQNSKIIIYREEEWFKCFIHETFHNFGLDFVRMNHNHFDEKIQKLFNINKNIKLYLFESYCEFWAEFINICFISFFMINTNMNLHLFSTFSLYVESLMDLEIFFSLFQMNKIMKHNGISKDYWDFSDFKQDSHVFEYYILKSVLLFNYKEFIIWCYKHNSIHSANNNKTFLSFNRNSGNLDKLYDFIEKYYKNPEFIKNLKNISHIKIKKNNKILTNTLRMSITDF